MEVSHRHPLAAPPISSQARQSSPSISPRPPAPTPGSKLTPAAPGWVSSSQHGWGGTRSGRGAWPPPPPHTHTRGAPQVLDGGAQQLQAEGRAVEDGDAVEAVPAGLVLAGKCSLAHLQRHLRGGDMQGGNGQCWLHAAPQHTYVQCIDS